MPTYQNLTNAHGMRTYKVAVTATEATLARPARPTPPAQVPQNSMFVAYNAGPNIAYVSTNTGDPLVTAPVAGGAAGGFPLGVGAYIALQMSGDTLGLICDTGNTASVYISFGAGN